MIRLDEQPVDLATPVCLVLPSTPTPAAQLLVNLANALPAQLPQYTRIAEIIDADDERRRCARERFKAYRELKFTLETHQIDETAGVYG
jgi:DNA polymerase IIIc chi subunit